MWEHCSLVGTLTVHSSLDVYHREDTCCPLMLLMMMTMIIYHQHSFWFSYASSCHWCQTHVNHDYQACYSLDASVYCRGETLGRPTSWHPRAPVSLGSVLGWWPQHSKTKAPHYCTHHWAPANTRAKSSSSRHSVCLTVIKQKTYIHPCPFDGAISQRGAPNTWLAKSH